MKRTELQHTYFKIKSSENLKLFKVKGISVVDYIQKRKKEIF